MPTPPFSRADLRALASEIPVVILAGGLGTRLSEETHLIPKPMIEIAGLPIIVHIMDYYSYFGFTKFVICGGYRSESIRNYFLTLAYAGKDVNIKFSQGHQKVSVTKGNHSGVVRDNWDVTVLETGLSTMTGARVRKALLSLEAGSYSHVCVTYGDGLTDVDLHEELAFSLEHGRVGTLLGVHPPTRFGILGIGAGNQVLTFSEKPNLGHEYINGGYFIFRSSFLDYLDTDGDSCILEKEPLEKLVRDNQLQVFRHEGFWQCMDNKREKDLLEDLARKAKAPWRKEVPRELRVQGE